jgi:serine/alanine adding enzyme
MSLKTEIITKANAAEWDSFASTVSGHSAFQSAALLLALGDNPCYMSHGRLFRDTSGKIVAGYVFFVIQELSGPAALLATRSLCNNGPLIAPEAQSHLEEILADLVAHPGLSGLYLDIWNNLDRSTWQEALRSGGFRHFEHLNYKLDLCLGEEELFRRISKRVRRYIRSNLDSLTIRPVESEEDMDVFYSMLKNTYVQVKVPLVPRSAFEAVHRSGLGWFLLAESEQGEPMACRVVLPFGKSLYDWYAGTSDLGYREHANASLVWHVLKQGTAEGFEVFDFGGAGKPGKPYGPRAFKEKFHGELVQYGRDRLVLAPFRYGVFNVLLKLREKLLAKPRGASGK